MSSPNSTHGAVLVVNAGSSSIKLSVFEGASAVDPHATLRVERIGGTDAQAILTIGGGVGDARRARGGGRPEP